MTDGVDLYTKYQTVTDWNAVRAAGKEFAYFKGTDGNTTRDTADWPAKARAAGLAVGLYGYAQPGVASDQYDLLLRTARARGAVDLAPALDLEDPFVPGNSAVQFAIAWLRRAVDSGQLPVYYANDSMMTYTLPAIRAAVPSVWPWIARYGAAPKNAYRTWQHSSTGRVPGITASGVDLNTGEVPRAGGGTPVTPPPVSGDTTEDELMDRITYPASKDTVSIRGALSGSANAAVVIRPILDADGDGPNPVYLVGILAWKGDANGHKFGIGEQYNPGSKGDILHVTTHTRFPTPGATWADVQVSSNEPFEIDWM
jgi:lysozyme